MRIRGLAQEVGIQGFFAGMIGHFCADSQIHSFVRLAQEIWKRIFFVGLARRIDPFLLPYILFSRSQSFVQLGIFVQA